MAREIVIRERPGGPRAGSEGLFSQLDRGAEAARVVAREQKAEVESELKFVGPQIVRQPFLLARPGLADHHPIFVTVGDAAQPANDFVNLGPVRTVERILRAFRVPRNVGVALDPHRIVAELVVLDEPLDYVDAKTVSAAVQPEADDAVDCLDHFGISKIQVGLLLEERVQVP